MYSFSYTRLSFTCRFGFIINSQCCIHTIQKYKIGYMPNLKVDHAHSGREKLSWLHVPPTDFWFRVCRLEGLSLPKKSDLVKPCIHINFDNFLVWLYFKHIRMPRYPSVGYKSHKFKATSRNENSPK